MNIKNKFIAVEGVIGVGKTTLANLLAKKLHAKLLLEQFEENPFLKEFYDDIKGKAFQTQLFFLLSRYRQVQQLFQTEIFHTNIVSDYMFMKDSIFANMTIGNHELALYNTIFSILKSNVVSPDLTIYLYADIDVVMDRIKKRNRDFEHNIQRNYILDLMRAYEDFFNKFSSLNVLKVNTNKLDFTKTPEVFDKLYRRLKKQFLK
ncbi:MAG: deoxynucleoside kinase [Candidatus Cloacimonadota bacterium]|nr:deoxynucleoside kinase [Candidatus Cloacimonadota bacterium]